MLICVQCLRELVIDPTHAVKTSTCAQTHCAHCEGFGVCYDVKRGFKPTDGKL